jgi:predicted NodU family carbamoyl transferase
VPLLLQADFALRGSTVVRDEYAAVQAFARSRLDALVIATRLFEQDSRVRM